MIKNGSSFDVLRIFNGCHKFSLKLLCIGEWGVLFDFPLWEDLYVFQNSNRFDILDGI